MKKMRLLLLLVFFITCNFLTHSQQDDVLFTIDEDEITVNEFLRVYKKNLDLVKDDSQKDVDNYLDLFVNYKLKLKEAYDLKLNEKPSYVRELKNYRSQLVKNFLTDHKVTDALVSEAYDRVTNEVKASHILIRLQEHDVDTIEAYKKITKLRERLINEDFKALQKELHNGSTVFVEDLGYFSGFKMVYDFESVAFNTNVGEVSQPFRTKFGYHVVKVFEKRPSRGEVKAAHIMVAKKKNDSLESSEKRIRDIYKKLSQGGSFESLAKQFSDDKSSASKGGELAKFKSGQLSSVVFEDMTFSLKEGETSKPFETQYGWHIVKSIEKIDNPTFNEIKSELEIKVKRDSRSKLINTSLISKLKKQYNVGNTKPDLSYFVNVLDSSFYKRKWDAPTVKVKTLVSIGNKNFTNQDFLNHISRSQRSYKGQESFKELVSRLYDEFLDISVKQYHEENLENVNEEFAQVVGEYRDGLLLFDLMEDKIWNAAKNDSVALQEFYNKNKSNYTWDDRIDAVIASSSDKKTLSQIKKRLKNGERIDVIEESVSNDESLDVIFTQDIMTKDHQLLPKGFEFKKGLSNIYSHNDAYHLVLVNKILPKAIKTLDEARGFVVTDFQEKIEKDWLKELHNKYKVVINNNVLEQIKESLKK